MQFNSLIRKKVIRLISLLTNSDYSKSIFYHDIHSKKKFTSMSTSISQFKSHILAVRDLGFDIVPKVTKNKRQLEISFDDGYLGLYENIRFLEELQISLQFFITTSFLGKLNYIDKIKLEELSNFSFVKIASHTHFHKDLTSLSKNELRLEFRTSKHILEDITNKEIDTISYPFGRFSPLVVSVAKEMGYNIQYSSIPGPFSCEVFDGVKRRSLVQDYSVCDLEAVLRGGDNILSSWYLKKHFMI